MIVSELRGLVAALGIAVLLAPSVALAASPEDRAVAESLFLEARKLMEEKNFPEACKKLEESQRLDPAPGTLLNLAVCHEQVGRLATAWGEFRQSLSFARREGRGDREKLASDRIAAIEPRLPHLIILVPADARVPSLVVKRDGTVVGDAAFGASLPVDPGDVVVEAEAPGYHPFKTTVKPAESQTVKVTIPKLERLPAQAAKPPGEQPPPPTGPDGRDIAGYALLGVGAVGLGIGTYFGITALSKKSDSDAHCPNERCDVTGVSLNTDAKHAARASDFGLGIGIVAAGAGAFLLLVRPDKTETSVGASPLPGGAMTSVRGTF